ncbi:LamG domain-containing protein, partial [bacterium]|nr:LamG domain-containing protein [bacterium]
TNANLTNTDFTNATVMNITSTNATTTGSNLSQAITNMSSGYVLSLDGLDDAVDLSSSSWMNTTPFTQTMTVECWFKTADTSNQKLYTTLVSRWETGGFAATSQFRLGMNSSGQITCWIGNNSGSMVQLTTTSSYKDALWHHASATYSGVTGVLMIYIDGALTTSSTNASFGNLSSSTSGIRLIIGSDHAGTTPNWQTDRQFRGSISDVRIWTAVRSASEIANNYRSRLIGNETSLAGYWKLNQGYGNGWGSYSAVMDSTNSRLHGTIVGAGATPSGSWIVSDINYKPRVSTLTLGSNNGVYSFSDPSFSFIDPSSNSLGDFSYLVSPSTVATVSNGAATTKTIYSLSGANLSTTLTTYEFPQIASLTSWQLDISFTTTGGSGTRRALIGDVSNNVNTLGWGLWVSANNKLQWSFNSASSEPTQMNVNLNTPYLLTAAQSSGTITLTLRNLDETYTNSLSISNSVALYSFDSTANDTSVNNNHLTNTNTVTYNISDYKRGSAAATFAGNNYFQVTNDGRFSPDNLSISFWVKPVSSAGSYQTIAACRNSPSPNNNGWIIYINPSNNLEFWSGTGTGWSGSDVSLFTSFGTLNTWVHVAFTLNKSTQAFVVYINGVAITTTTRTYINNTGTNLRIGAGGNEGGATYYMKSGSLVDDFRIYNKVLTAAEVGTIVAGSSYDSSITVGSNVIGRGPVTIGTWPNLSSENFSGTISYVNVSVPTSQRVITISSGTDTPATVTAIQDSSLDFGSGSQTASLTVNKIAPTIGTLTAPAKNFGDASFNLTNPTSNSNGAFSYSSSNTSVATVTTGGTVTIVGAGNTTITATQAATTNYTSGSVTASLVVSQAAPAIGALSAPAKTYGDASFNLT